MTRRTEAVLSGAQQFWLGWANGMRRWHRYEVDGIEHLDGPRAKLILGYHGRGHASDLICLNGALFERHGQIPISILHSYTPEARFGNWLCTGLECVVEDGPQLASALDAGRHLVILPGGNREANRPFWVRYQVDWGRRTGFIRLALKYKLDIVMVASSGTDWACIGFNDGYEWGKRMKVKGALPAWFGLGFGGPAALAPNFPVKFHQQINPPINLVERFGDVDPSDRVRLLEVQAELRDDMQRLVDRAIEVEGGVFNTKAGSARP